MKILGKGSRLLRGAVGGLSLLLLVVALTATPLSATPQTWTINYNPANGLANFGFDDTIAVPPLVAWLMTGSFVWDSTATDGTHTGRYSFVNITALPQSAGFSTISWFYDSSNPGSTNLVNFGNGYLGNGNGLTLTLLQANQVRYILYLAFPTGGLPAIGGTIDITLNSALTDTFTGKTYTAEDALLTCTAGCGPPQIPEPSSLLLLGSGLLAIAGVVRRRMVR